MRLTRYVLAWTAIANLVQTILRISQLTHPVGHTFSIVQCSCGPFANNIQELRQSGSDRLMLDVCAKNCDFHSGIICQSLLEAITGTLVVRVYCSEIERVRERERERGVACQWPVGFMWPINICFYWLTVGIWCEVDSGSHFGRVQRVK